MTGYVGRTYAGKEILPQELMRWKLCCRRQFAMAETMCAEAENSLDFRVGGSKISMTEDAMIVSAFISHAAQKI